MIKKTIFFFVVSVFHLSIYAQNIDRNKLHLSPLTKKYLLELEKSGSKNIFPGEYIYKNISGKYYLSAILKVNKAIDLKALSVLNVFIGTKAGNIWTAQIPVENMKAFIKVDGIDYIQLDEPVFLNLDSARHNTHVDSVHQGISLPHAYTGKDVVVGIIDAGFDYTHPTLLDTSGTGYRVKKVWEQKSSGTPPSGYIYGNELADSLSIWNDGYDATLLSHGTHVAGIAAGSGFGSSADNHRFRGIAFESDLVLVGIKPDQDQWTSTGLSNLIDGINYIYEYAASVGKPAVVNLSWGCSMGPHDGTSLFSQAVDQLTGSGKIFVCAAGNNGTDNIHLNKTFTATDTLLRTVVGFSSYLGSKKTWIDAWGDSSKSFCASVTLYNGITAGNSTGFICLDNNIHNLYLIGSAGDTCYINITTSSSDFNGKSRIFFDLYSKTTNKIMIALKGTSGTVNMWTGYVKDYTGYYGYFYNGGLSWATAGNKSMTISDFASTHSAISTAAYASKTTFTNIDGAFNNYNSYVIEGNLAPFSSHGPAADSLTKPDIAAPGLVLGSAINSFDTTYNTGGANRPDVITCYTSPLNSKNYCYAMMMGTSMASPMTTGIVALMLQADPNLNPENAKEIIRQTAITDNNTGTITTAGSNLWGFGKINAYAAVKKTWQTINVNNIANKGLDYMIYPNPSRGNFSIEYISEINDVIIFEIVDLTGRSVYKEKWNVSQGFNNKKFDLSNLSNGAYFIKINTTLGMSVYKMIKN